MAEGDRLAAKYGSSSLTQVGRVPASGTATYDGVAVYNDGQMVSDAQLRANFGTDRITANMTNFTYYTGQTLSGSLNMTDGRITGNRFAGTVNGTVTGPGGSGTIIGDLDGGFVGSTAQGAVGLIDAQLYTTFGNERLTGALIVEQ